MTGSSGFDPIFGKMSWEVPAEVRTLEGELRTAKQIDLGEFNNEVLKRVQIFELVADRRLANIDPLSVRPSAEREQDKPLIVAISEEEYRKQEEEKRKAIERTQREIEETERLLKEKITSEIVIAWSDLPKSTSNNIISQEKLRIAKQSAREVHDAERIAGQFLDWEDIRQRYCPSIKCISDDVFTIANTMVSVLAPLSIAGTISFPLNPMLWAVVATAIAKVGVRNFCKDSD